MEEINIKQRDLTKSMLEVQFLVLPILLALGTVTLGLYYLFWRTIAEDGFFDLYIFIPTLLAGIVVHELIHGLSCTYFGKLKGDAIKYGFQLKTLTPYAHCKQPLKKNAYVKGALMPLLLLGILPYILALATGNNWLLWFAVIMTASASGDIWIVWLIRHVKAEELVLDHPSKAGCIVYEADEH